MPAQKMENGTRMRGHLRVAQQRANNHETNHSGARSQIHANGDKRAPAAAAMPAWHITRVRSTRRKYKYTYKYKYKYKVYL
jgi:hypothetical protein